MASAEHLLLSTQTHRDANLYLQELREQEELLFYARSRNMAPAQALAFERRVSHGIGGAGNIRRPSEVMFAAKERQGGTGKERRRSFAWFPSDVMFAARDKDGETGKERRRSFVWSKSTPAPVSSMSDKRSSILSIFKSGGRW